MTSERFLYRVARVERRLSEVECGDRDADTLVGPLWELASYCSGLPGTGPAGEEWCHWREVAYSLRDAIEFDALVGKPVAATLARIRRLLGPLFAEAEAAERELECVG